MDGHASNSRRSQGSTESQIWITVMSKIHGYSNLQPKVISGLKTLNVLHHNLSDPSHADEHAAIPAKLDKIYEISRRDNAEAQRFVAEALDQIGALTALRSHAVDTESFSQDRKDNKRRRLDASPAASPSLQQGAFTGKGASPPASVAMNASLSSSRSSLGGSKAGMRSSAGQGMDQSTSRGDPSRKLGKRDGLADGRKVVFRRPENRDTGERPDFILVQVLKNLGNDTYQVQDVEPDDNSAASAGDIFTTTIKSLIVLPDPRDRSTYPVNDYPASTEVMALFPDTTSFYHAKVVGTPGVKKLAYKVIFDDDGSTVRSIDPQFIALWPKKKF